MSQLIDEVAMIPLPHAKRLLILAGSIMFASWHAPHIRAQSDKQATAPSAEQGIKLVESGHCTEALPILKRRLPQTSDKTLRYRVEMATVRCAMALDQEQTAVDTLLMLKRESPGDAEVLYITTHYFSELGMRAAQQLQATAPDSYQQHRLEAETLESQGKNTEASAIYAKILETNPHTPGIHYRLGQIALDQAGANGPTDEAKKEFQKELDVDPSNASAEFILGELARRAAQWDEAIGHFAHAVKLDAGFTEAQLALGMSLAASGKFAEAISPLERYVKMQPEDPAGHYQLALAYSRTGNKDGATREMALQAQAASHSRTTTDTAEGHSVHP
jgi:predicted Zn-dependent protease